MSGIGPVEPEPGAREHAPRPAGAVAAADTLTAGVTGTGGWWRVLGPRRRLALPALAVAVFGGYLALSRPAPAEPPPVPWPAQATDMTYAGIVAPADRVRRTVAFRLRAYVRAGPAVTVESVRQNYAGLTTSVVPHPPVVLKAGEIRIFAITLFVRKCDGLPLDAGMPFLDVTLRNDRAAQKQSYILGQYYARDLSAGFHDICAGTKYLPLKP